MPHDAADGPHGPRSPTTELSPAEELLICSLQDWSDARLAGHHPHGALRLALTAKTSPCATALFIAWIEAVEVSTLRPIRGQCRHCGGASTDLQRLVLACGLAPVAFALGEKLLASLVSEPRAVMTLAWSLNAALAQAGRPLPARLPEGGPRAMSPTRH